MKFLKNLLAAFIGSLIAFGFLMLLTFGIIGGLVGGLMSSSEPVTVYPNSVLKIDLSSAIGEQTVSEPLDFSTIVPYSGSTSSLGILDAVKSIDHAAQDPDIKFIYLTNCAYSSGLAYMEELRGALERFRASGKPVIAYGQNFSLGGYYLASVADKIYSDEFASNNILGVSTTIFFLKDILDRFGVEMQLIRHGKYKSAGEQFIADNISEANREQNQAMVDALWQTVRDGICRSRGITPDALDRMVNNLELNTAEHMLNAGLIDGVYTVNEMEDQLRMLSGAEKIKDVKMITLDKYAKARLKTDYKIKDKIAVIYADGQINVEGPQRQHHQGSSPQGQLSRRSRTARRDHPYRAGTAPARQTADSIVRYHGGLRRLLDFGRRRQDILQQLHTYRQYRSIQHDSVFREDLQGHRPRQPRDRPLAQARRHVLSRPFA